MEQISERKVRRLAKKEKKHARAKRRADFAKRHQFLFFIGRFAILGVVVAGLTLTLKNGYEMYRQYKGTLKWEQADDTPIAEIDTDVLYSSKEEREARVRYDRTQSEIWDSATKNFKGDVSEDKMKILKEAYEGMTDNAKLKVEDYDEIVALWDIRTKIDQLFTDKSHQAFVADIDLVQLSETVTESFNIVANYLTGATKKHDAASQILEELYTIADAATSMISIISITNESYKLANANNAVTLSTSMDQETYETLKTNVANLPYTWDFVNKILQPLIDKSATTVEKNQALIDDYNRYLADQDRKAQFEKYVSDYNTAMQNLKNSIVPLPNFIGQSLASLQNWANNNNITLKVTYVVDSSMVGLVMTQNPSAGAYNKIVAGSTVSVTVGRAAPIVLPSSTNSSSSTLNSSSSSSLPEISSSSTLPTASSVETETTTSDNLDTLPSLTTAPVEEAAPVARLSENGNTTVVTIPQ